MQKIVIIGATSGIGLHLARLYAAAGHLVGATGRRQELLYALQLEYPNHITTECYDATGSQATAHLMVARGKTIPLDTRMGLLSDRLRSGKVLAFQLQPNQQRK
jgi:NADP-dependent 3-hydroxy acid dehydrogenase YdfG